MSDRRTALGDESHDRGFTLIETVIVMSTIGLIAAALAATVTVVLRTAPPAEERANDARSLQGLVTWIPQDVDAARPDGFDTDPTEWPCGGPAPTDSHNVLAISWSERNTITTNYAATYRYEFDGTDWHIARYACDDVASGTMSTGERINLTSALPPWNDLAPPASVTMCDTTVDDAGNCPAGHEILTHTSSDVESIKLRITRIDGAESTIDAAPKNPDQDLADDPFASPNSVPTVSPQTNYVLDMQAGETTTLDLNTSHNPYDADGDTLSVAIDSSEPMPAGIAASTSDPMDLTLTADPSLLPGTISPPIVLVISDPRAGWVDATVTINIVPAPNQPPTAAANYDLFIAPGEAVSLPFDVTHGATDPDGDPLQVIPLTWPNSYVFSPTTNAPGDPLELNIEAKGSLLPGPAPAPVSVIVDDGRGGFVAATVTIIIVAPTSNSDPIVLTPDVPVNMLAGDTYPMQIDLTHSVIDPDGDPISVDIDTSQPQPPGITTTILGGMNIEITADPGLIDGPVAIPVSLLVEDIWGNSEELTVSITIDPVAPPPSDCVLGTLSASPNPVDRQGNGSGPRHLKNDVTVTLTYSGSCDGLVLTYDTGDTSGLGIGTGRVFPPGSPSQIVIYGKGNGGTEKWLTGSFTLTASTTSAVSPNQLTMTLTVN